MSGKHKNPRRLLGATPEQWAAWQAAAELQDLSLNEWLRRAADAAARKQGFRYVVP
jgi:hypothetical protein